MKWHKSYQKQGQECKKTGNRFPIPEKASFHPTQRLVGKNVCVPFKTYCYSEVCSGKRKLFHDGLGESGIQGAKAGEKLRQTWVIAKKVPGTNGLFQYDSDSKGKEYPTKEAAQAAIDGDCCGEKEADAVKILHDRHIGDDPDRKASLQEARGNST